MELKRVSIQGESYPVYFGVYGLTRIMKKYEITYGELLQKLNSIADIMGMSAKDFDFLYDVIHAGFDAGAKVMKVEFPYTAEDLMLFMPLSDKGLAEVFSAINDSSPQEEPDQKKTRPKRKVKAGK